MRDAGCQLPKVAPLKLSFRNGLPKIGLRDVTCGIPTSQSFFPENSSPKFFPRNFPSHLIFVAFTLTVDLLMYLKLRNVFTCISYVLYPVVPIGKYQ